MIECDTTKTQPINFNFCEIDGPRKRELEKCDVFSESNQTKSN